jgi:hypothetical protein
MRSAWRELSRLRCVTPSQAHNCGPPCLLRLACLHGLSLGTIACSNSFLKDFCASLSKGIPPLGSHVFLIPCVGSRKQATAFQAYGIQNGLALLDQTRQMANVGA